MKRYIFVTFQREGLHCYPAAATDPMLATGSWDDVSFLASVHRHVFHFKVQISVEHNDRDIEFIQLKRWCERQYDTNVLSFNHKSCEMLAEELGEKILATYPGRELTITVSEDNENGAVLVF